MPNWVAVNSPGSRPGGPVSNEGEPPAASTAHTVVQMDLIDNDEPQNNGAYENFMWEEELAVKGDPAVEETGEAEKQLELEAAKENEAVI